MGNLKKAHVRKNATNNLHSENGGNSKFFFPGSYLSVDPGLTNTGWSVWKPGHKLPIDFGLLTIPTLWRNAQKGTENLSWEKRALLYARALRGISNYGVESTSVETVYCEFPAFFNTAGGQMVAGKGDLSKLIYLIGVIRGVVFPTKFKLVPVNKWKGQLPKNVVINRIKRYYEKYPEFLSNVNLKKDVWDSVGIGLHVRKQGGF